MASKPPETPRQPLSKLRPRARRSSRPLDRFFQPVGSGRKKGGHQGFTIIDVVAALTIVAILVVLTVPNLDNFVRKAQEVRCMANMRNITVGLRGYLQDHGNVWPQGPPPNGGAAWEDFWLGALQPYGITDKTWQCPAISARMKQDAPRVHYTPTMFPSVPGIADRWATQPWLIERGQGHGNGALICFPDGSIKSFDKVLAEQGLR